MFDTSHRNFVLHETSFSFESVVMAILWACVLILLFHFIRKRTKFIQNFGIVTMIILLAAMFIRACLPLDFAFTHNISSVLYGDILYFLTEVVLFYLPGTQIPVTAIGILCFVWAAGTLVTLIHFIRKTRKALKELRSTAHAPLEQDYKMLEKAQIQQGKHRQVILHRAMVLSPLTYGYFRPKIMLPSGRRYTDTELYCVFQHELTHFYHRDAWIKLIVQIFCCLFWWNPLVYLLREDVNQVVELHCDAAVCARLTPLEQCDYLQTIAMTLKTTSQVKKQIHLSPQAFSEFAASSGKEKMKQRIQILLSISDTPKRTKWYYVLLCGLLVIVLFFSYFFILKPNMRNWNSLENMTSIDISPETCYLVEYPEDCYFLIEEYTDRPGAVRTIYPLDDQWMVEEALNDHHLSVFSLDKQGFMDLLAASGTEDPQADYDFWAYLYFSELLTEQTQTVSTSEQSSPEG